MFLRVASAVLHLLYWIILQRKVKQNLTLRCVIFGKRCFIYAIGYKSTNYLFNLALDILLYSVGDMP